MTPRTNSMWSNSSTPDATSSIGTISGGSLAILRLAVDGRRELRERPQAVLGPRLGQVGLEPLALLPGPVLGHHRGDLVHVDARVPEVEVRHPGELPDRLPVGLADPAIDRAPLLGVEPAIASGHREAGDQPLDVPLERARQRLVEVVDAEYQPPVGRAEGAEVGQVRIAAELHVEPGPRRVGQVGRHRIRGPAEERERRDEHAPVADRDELGHARRRLLLQQLDRIRRSGAGCHSPCAARGADTLAAFPFSARSAAVKWTTAFGPAPVGWAHARRWGLHYLGHQAAPFAADLQMQWTPLKARPAGTSSTRFA